MASNVNLDPKNCRKTGFLSELFDRQQREIKVLRSAAGSYLGTSDEDGPCSRESVEYWRSTEEARNALESDQWTQNLHD